MTFNQDAQNMTNNWRLLSLEGELKVFQDQVTIRTNGKEQFLLAEMELSEGINISQENLVLDIKINHLQGLKYLHFKLQPNQIDGNKYILLDVPLLEDTEANFLAEGEWTTLHISMSNGTLFGMTREDSQERIRYLRIMTEDSLLTPVEIHLRNVTKSPRAQGGCISLHFDDGYRHHFEIVAHLLKRYSNPQEDIFLRATAFVMPRQLNQPGYLTIQELQALVNEYDWEVGAHHSDALTQMSSDQFIQEMDYVIAFFKQQDWAIFPLHFAYPLGKMNRLSRERVGQYFGSARLISGGPETLPPADWYRLRAINVTPFTSANKLAQIAQHTVENGGWAIFMFHHIVENPKAFTEFARSEFEIFLKFLQEKKYKTTRIRELYEQYSVSKSQQ